MMMMMMMCLCLTVTSRYCVETAGRFQLVFDLNRIKLQGNSGILKMTVLPSGTFSPALDLRKCRHDTLVVTTSCYHAAVAQQCSNSTTSSCCESVANLLYTLLWTCRFVEMLKACCYVAIESLQLVADL